MLCNSCGEEIKGEAVLGLCEKCWKKELKKGQSNSSNENVQTILKKNKLSKTLELFASTLMAVLTIAGLCVSGSISSIFPILIFIIVGLVQTFFFYALAEIIQKLQNIEDNTKEYDNRINKK